jgi:hypothetical protein
MRVLPVLQGQETDEGDWEWTGHFERLLGSLATLDVEGHWLQLLNPVVAPPTHAGSGSGTTYHFLSAELVAVANLLHDRVKAETDRLQSVPWGDTFPYRSNKGMNCVLGYLLVFSLYFI